MKTYYGSLCAWFYDIDKPFAPKEELDFYLSYAHRGMSILEPMCGSGRFLVGFANRGFYVDGFDLSSDMIERCKSKIRTSGIGVGKLECCDFSAFTTDKLYDCIYIAAYSFSLFIDSGEILSRLKQMKDLLRPGGKILMGVLTDLNYRNGATETDTLRSAREDDIEITLESKSSYDRVKSVTYSQMTYRLLMNDEFIRAENEDFYVKYYRPNELEKLVSVSGLQIEDSFAGFSKTAFLGQDTEAVIYVMSRGDNAE